MSAVPQRKSYYLACITPGFDSRQDRNFKFLPETEIRRHGRAEPQSLVSVSNISALNPKSLAFFVNAYLLLIATRSLDGDVKT